jgi:hypothetical protein
MFMPFSESKGKTRLDKLADAALPKADDSHVSERSTLWWIFVMPGKVILWLEYMFPSRLVNAFGSARRRNVPLIQVLYSLTFYVFFAAILIGILVFVGP